MKAQKIIGGDRLTRKDINRVTVVNNNKPAEILTGNDSPKSWLDEI